MKLLSTRARAHLWKLQEAVRTTSRERERWMRLLNSGRSVLSSSSHRDLWMEFSCADQEHQYAVAALREFCEFHDGVSATGRHRGLTGGAAGGDGEVNGV